MDLKLLEDYLRENNLTGLIDSFWLCVLDSTIDDLQRRPIHNACSDGNLEFVKLFISLNCSIECEDKYKCRPIHRACISGHSDIVKMLIEHHCNIECEDQYKWRPIHYASIHGHLDVVKLLVESNCDIECQDTYKCRPIHHACSNGHVDIAKLLIENRCLIECGDDSEWSPLHHACTHGNLDVVMLLINNQSNIECEDAFKWRPIHRACKNGHLDVVKLLIDKECNLECEDDDKWRPIHRACWHGHIDIVKLLIERQCDVECEDDFKWRPIHRACINGNLDIVKLLIENHCNVECEDGFKWRPIHRACKNGHVKIVKLLIETSCDIECEDINKWRPIHHACKSGHLDIVKLLTKNRCEVECKTQDGETPLELLRQADQQSFVTYLTQLMELPKIFHYVRVNNVKALEDWYYPALLTAEERETGLSILEVALQANATEVIQFFLNKTIDDEEISSWKTYIEDGSRDEAIQLLTECFLFRSIKQNHSKGFHLFCLAKAINASNRIVKPFLEIVAEHGNISFIENILVKSIYKEDEWAKAAKVAITKGHYEIATAISNREALLKDRSKAHWSILHTAICDNDPDMVAYILGNNLSDPNFINEVVGSGLALAHILCHAKCIEVLEKFHVDVNTKNKYMQSPLHEAVASGMTDHCSYLIDNTHDIDTPGFMGITSLQYSAIRDCEELCLQLMKNGADCMRYVENLQQDSFNKSVLPISTSENAVTLCMKMNGTLYPCFLERLNLENVNSFDGDENSLLHLAVKLLQPHLCKALTNAGANVEIINKLGNTPLLELLSNTDCQNVTENLNQIQNTLTILIESGSDINKISSSGLNAFQCASRWNNEKFMLLLLTDDSNLISLSEADFKLAFSNNWLNYAKALTKLISDDHLRSFITSDIIQLALSQGDTGFTISLFKKANDCVQQSMLEDLLYHMASMDEYDSFVSLLNTEIKEPKLLSNKETLLTSLLKESKFKYSLPIIQYSINSKWINFRNIMNQTPLQVAIQQELFDLIDPLIFVTDELNTEDIDGNTPVMQLFRKLSISTDIAIDLKLLAAIKTIISRGGDIYKITSTGKRAIDCCARLTIKTEIESFEISQRDLTFVKKPPVKICRLCCYREAQFVMACGHVLCKTCSTEKLHCPNCESTQ